MTVLKSNHLLFVCLALAMQIMGHAQIPQQEPKAQKVGLVEIPTQKKRDSQRPKIALVLGGGGSKGIAHVGVIRELESDGIHPDLIVGCSSGALIGALYAANPNINKLENLLIKVKCSEFFDFSFLSPRFGFMKTKQMKLFLKKHVKHNEFERLKIPLVITATDLVTGDTVEMDKGELIKALLASSAVPMIFKPIKHQERLLVDGGVTDPIPVDVAKARGAQVIIAVDVSAQLSQYQASHLFGVAKRSLEICYRELADRVVENADVVIRMDFKDIGMFSHKKNFQVYDRGRKMTRKALPIIRKCIAEKLKKNPVEQE